LEPRNDFVHGTYGLLGLKAVHFIAESYIDSGVPNPSDPHVDFTIVNLLKLDSQVKNCPMRNEPERKVRFQCGVSLNRDFDSNAR
jgi:hypothetical protein